MKKIILTASILMVVIVSAYFLIQYFGKNKNQVVDLNSVVENAKPDNNQDQEFNVEILEKGSGPTAQNGDKLTVHYTGSLLNGTKFDSSIDRGDPFSFILGQGSVIEGWDLGLLGVQIGEKRKLIIPSELGYGETGTPGGPIPPNATLVF